MRDPAIGGGCAHHFCFGCYVSWSATKFSCPTCRAPAWRIMRDPEFAEAVGASADASPHAAAQAHHDQHRHHQHRHNAAGAEEAHSLRKLRIVAPAGMTVGHRRAGDGRCVVTRVVPRNGAAQAGVCVGDVILAVNGTPVRDHRQCVEFIEARSQSAGDCEIEVQRWRWSRRWLHRTVSVW